MPGLGLWPQTPQKWAGSLSEPQTSEPRPIKEAADANRLAYNENSQILIKINKKEYRNTEASIKKPANHKIFTGRKQES